MYTKDSMCFTARWISPKTGKPVTALHFSSFLERIRKRANNGNQQTA